MRRILVGGLSLSFGLAGGPAFAQERAATFGRPVAVMPAAPVVAGDPGITPAGGFDRAPTPAPAAQTLPAPRPFTAVVPGTVAPGYRPQPIFTQPTTPAAPVPMPPGMPTPMPGGAKPQGGPSVTEMRDNPAGVPNGAATPTLVPGYGVPMFPGTPLLPSIGVPCGPEGGYACPQPDLDAPLFSGAVPGGAVPGGMIPDGVFGDPGAGTFAGRPRRWLSAEYLMWWTKSAPAPILVTSSVAVPANPNLNSIFAPGTTAYKGILGDPTTSVLYGGNSIARPLQSGGRFTLGTWFSDQQLWGIEGQMFFLGQATTTFAVDSSQYPVLARPFTAVNPGIGPPASEVLAFPGLSAGAIQVTNQTELWGIQAAFRRNLYAGCSASLDLLLGYRSVTLKERLEISELALAQNPLVPSSVVTDSFRTENQFHGGMIGLAGMIQRGRWSVDGRASIAFGTMFQKAEIDGGQWVATAAGVQAFQGGLLAQPGANIGTFSQSRFAVVPEVGVNIGYAITPRARIFVGYNVLYLSSVLRPGNVIDTGLDVTRIPNFMLNQATSPVAVPRPAPVLRGTDFFAQGINFGLAFTW